MARRHKGKLVESVQYNGTFLLSEIDDISIFETVTASQLQTTKVSSKRETKAVYVWGKSKSETTKRYSCLRISIGFRKTTLTKNSRTFCELVLFLCLRLNRW